MNKLLQTWESMCGGDIVKNTLLRINNDYDKHIVYPEKKQVFKPFQLCNLNDTKVVIMGMSPYHDGKATGIPFANKEDTIKLSSSLELIKDRVETDIYHGFNLDFDITLESWLKQGVMLLNTALTVVRGRPDSHIQYWFPVIREIIKNSSKYNKDIIYCLWGRNAQMFKRFINPECKILESLHPSYYVRKKEPFYCDHFIEINRILSERNKEKINW